MPRRTFTENLRLKVQEAMGWQELDCRDLAHKLGVAHSSVWRFVSDGKNPSAPLIDKLMAWLDS